jgi:hypothetical protein
MKDTEMIAAVHDWVTEDAENRHALVIFGEVKDGKLMTRQYANGDQKNMSLSLATMMEDETSLPGRITAKLVKIVEERVNKECCEEIEKILNEKL